MKMTQWLNLGTSPPSRYVYFVYNRRKGVDSKYSETRLARIVRGDLNFTSLVELFVQCGETQLTQGDNVVRYAAVV